MRNTKNSPGFSGYFLSLCLAGMFFLSGCVRLAGTAGYWHTDPEGETTAKQAGFDTADYTGGNTAQGKITI